MDKEEYEHDFCNWYKMNQLCTLKIGALKYIATKMMAKTEDLKRIDATKFLFI
jgi:hypothetical protein